MRGKELAVYAVYLALGVILYASVLSGYFLSDDFQFVGGASQGDLSGLWGHRNDHFLRSFIVLSFIVDYSLWKCNPVGYHLTNLFFHIVNAGLVFLLARRLFRLTERGRPVLMAFLSGLLFVALPCHSEAVSWISGRSDVICTTFALISSIFFVALLEGFSYRRFLGFLVFFAASLFSKESAIVLPAVWTLLFAAHRVATGRTTRNYRLVALLSGYAALGVYFVFRKVVLGRYIGGYGTEMHTALFNPAALLNVYLYLIRTFLPPLSAGILLHPLLLSLPGLAMAVFLFVLLKRARPLRTSSFPIIAALVGCWVVSLLPVATLRVGFSDTQAERFLYLPSVFACIALVAAFGAVIARRSLLITALAILVAVESLCLVKVNQRWATAGRIAKALVEQISPYDPSRTIILNLPDNYRGAYVFRNGLPRATALFEGKDQRRDYRVLCLHDVQSLDGGYSLERSGEQFTLKIPEECRIHKVKECGLSPQVSGNTIMFSPPEDAGPTVGLLVSYEPKTPTAVVRPFQLDKGDIGFGRETADPSE